MNGGSDVLEILQPQMPARKNRYDILIFTSAIFSVHEIIL